MTLHAKLRPAAFSVGIALFVILVVLGVFAYQWAHRMQWAHETLETLAPRHARLLGLQGEGDRILTALSEADRRLATLAHGAEHADERVAAELQQRVRQAAVEAGFIVVGSQILPASDHGTFVVVPVSVTLEGDLAHLFGFVDSLQAQQPAARIIALIATPLGGRGVTAERNLRIDATIGVARLLP